ncbi:hypothetical protein GAH_00983 [Geoglobus ahangari]|uniref:DUF302 domain-containing protein n=1 Tax=Geoglobus ahangari TaxID=113653 RepID=A0A0F7IFP2_9EURY|nr:DUF302 domain-containing protein [Geoglobus ahangari]AKG91692.1 hypothetical protein GAH_00983 [Geoglobus ahangari]NOY10980.1 DUF302 domain-containing protein [Archaeoglobi archaeon]
MVGYGKVVDLGFDEAVERVKERLAEEGFSVVCEIDVGKTIREKIGKEIGRYVILGACNPHHSFNVLSANREFGLLMPCNVVVYSLDDGVHISAITPLALAQQFGDERITETAGEVEESLKRVIDSI